MHWIRLFLILPYAITVSYPFALLTRLLFGGSLEWQEKIVLTNEFPRDSWFGRGLYKKWSGTTLGVGIMYKSPARTRARTVAHELHHVEQSIAASCAALIHAIIVLLCTGDWGLSLLLWWSGGFMIFVGGFIVALLEGENIYRGSFHEEGAYPIGREAEAKDQNHD